MTEEELIEYLSLQEVCELYGNVRGNSEKAYADCPECKKKYSLEINHKGGKCFRCNFRAFNGVDYYKKVNNIPKWRAIKELIEIFGIDKNGTIKKRPKASNLVDEEKRIQSLDANLLNKIYSEFSNSSALIGEKKLTDEDYAYLKDRGISDEDIAENGYFSMPSRAVMTPLVERLKEIGVDHYLENTPGFFYRNAFDDWSFYYISSIVIPLKNEFSNIVRLQMRKRLLVNKNDKRYMWFSSNNVSGDIPNYNGYSKGTGTGAPIAINLAKGSIQPQIIITEGHFKAFVLSKLGYHVISIQGVNSYKIEDVFTAVENISKIQGRKFEEISVFFDADMKYNPQVLKAVAKAADQLKTKYLVTIGTWDVDEGKGIDDFLAAGHDISEVKFIPYDDFKKVADAFIAYKNSHGIDNKESDLLKSIFDEMAAPYNF